MSNQVNALVDYFFRKEYGKAVSFLTARYGAGNLELAEDAVQEALYKAMKTWPYTQIPLNPSAWIIKVASNNLIDHFRKSMRIDLTECVPDNTSSDQTFDMDTIKDDVVKMMFACCHPSLSTEYQIILTLKILGGLSIREIARALLKKDEAVAKAYTRAKNKFKEENAQLTLPSQPEITNRLNTVLHIIYLLFNEGYKATEGEGLLQIDLCNEAIRLTDNLLGNDACDISMTHALLALMYFHSSRFGARVDQDGNLVTLEYQDRNKWDSMLIGKAMDSLQKATKGAFMNEFYLQAAISGVHCTAKTYQDTKWGDILALYNLLLSIKPSPIVRLNRIVALSKAKSASVAMEEFNRIAPSDQMEDHYLFHAIKAELHLELKQSNQAIDSLEKAISLTTNKAERLHLKNKVERIGTAKNQNVLHTNKAESE